MTDHYDTTHVMLAELTIAAGRMDAFLAYTIPNLAVSRAWPGNSRFDMLVDEARPGRVLFYEIWDSVEVQQAYMAWRAQAGDVARLTSFLAAAPDFTALRAVRD
ncbi:putative quinol monooxygenase [Sphingomonas sp.]|uniref:putative quinol monooxygenase n=1 Tax=Sphingomonas sp. TaxID=28214 RepID=UPI003B009D6F